ncbi:exonuclease [Myroides sp. M-43]|uniref:exonuclease domain-containing protein n=1 Tax=Myroides oncorhynchi TaxID=2893756 RepID=UPI001E4B0636|nr:exonuclease domain-containing protein [Myroides oncorhynchi]MCC9043702.1 exonuclease [Myroides oncorhynchi]
MYAVLDIETTGGQFNEEGITEIAIYKFDGNQIVDQFISLVNPEMEIQPFVVKLTGINTSMLRLAPKFYEVAKRIIEITQNCVLVAHNAEFDYRVLRNEFKRLGYEYSRNTLCTVELSQKLLPDMPSYSLGKLVRSLGIPIADRHRANGDAMATEKLFELLLSKDKEKTILTSMIKSDIKTGINPKFLDIIDTLPSTVGIYYILDKEGTIIFIGKSKNIRKKVLQHFTSNSAVFKKIQQESYTVTFEKTGTELIALLKEAEEIQTNKPKYNKVNKSSVFPYSLYLKANIEGYIYLAVEKTDGRKKNFMAFTSPNEARKFLHKVFQGQSELPYVNFIYEKKSTKITENNFFVDFTQTREQFNAKVLELLKPFDIDNDNVIIIDKGRKVDEKSAVALEKGKLNGYCFFNLNHQINAPERIAANLTPVLFNRNSRNIILNYLNKKSGYKLIHY